jgi:hypothetical protein
VQAPLSSSISNSDLFLKGGMLSLVDVYCFYNRARGVNLISPDDLLVDLSYMIEIKYSVLVSLQTSPVAAAAHVLEAF